MTVSGAATSAAVAPAKAVAAKPSKASAKAVKVVAFRA